MVLNRNNKSIDSNIFARQIQATSPKGTVEPPTVKGPDGSPGLPQGGNSVVDKVLAAAHDQVGKPYVFGSGPDTSSFDCSDLVQWAYKQAGINLPRVTGDQIKQGTNVKWGEFQPGDLIFSHGGGHVVMYVGNGKVIAAPHTGTVVQYQPVSRFRDSFTAAKRIA
jgi:cell wall-associated NlpC family hydrolase